MTHIEIDYKLCGEGPRWAHVKPEEPCTVYLGGDLYGMTLTMREFPESILDERLLEYNNIEEFIVEYIEEFLTHEHIHIVLNDIIDLAAADMWDNLKPFWRIMIDKAELIALSLTGEIESISKPWSKGDLIDSIKSRKGRPKDEQYTDFSFVHHLMTKHGATHGRFGGRFGKDKFYVDRVGNYYKSLGPFPYSQLGSVSLLIRLFGGHESTTTS